MGASGMTDDGERPGRAGYWFGGAAVFAGGAAMAYLLAEGLTRAIDAMPRVPAPGRVEIVLEAGRHTLFLERRRDGFEHERMYDRVFGPAGPYRGMTVAVTAADGGDALIVDGDGAGANFALGDVTALSFGGVDVPERGLYVVETATPEGAAPAAVALGRDFGGAMVRASLWAAAAFVIGLGLGLTLIIRTALRRRRATAPSRPQA